jgi:hypothetical protein
MFITFDLQQPLPPGFALSYGKLQYGNYGRGCWQYAPFQFSSGGGSFGPPGQIYSGAIEWINQPHWMSQPKYPNPYAFAYNLFPGVIMLAQINVAVNAESAGAVLNGVETNIATGAGIKQLLSNF